MRHVRWGHRGWICIRPREQASQFLQPAGTIQKLHHPVQRGMILVQATRSGPTSSMTARSWGCWRRGGPCRRMIFLLGRWCSARREMGEQNDEEQRQQRSKNAAQQPELPPSQDEQPGPARATGRRQARFLVVERVCGHRALGGVSRYSDTGIPLLFPCERSLPGAGRGPT